MNRFIVVMMAIYLSKENILKHVHHFVFGFKVCHRNDGTMLGNDLKTEVDHIIERLRQRCFL